MWQKTFRESFCERIGCPLEQYEKRVFWRCLYRRSLPLAVPVYLLKQRFFTLDLQTIRQLGFARSTLEFRTELENFRYDYRMQGGLLRFFRVRISGKRVMSLLRSVAPAHTEAPSKRDLLKSA